MFHFTIGASLSGIWCSVSDSRALAVCQWTPSSNLSQMPSPRKLSSPCSIVSMRTMRMCPWRIQSLVHLPIPREKSKDFVKSFFFLKCLPLTGLLDQENEISETMSLEARSQLNPALSPTRNREVCLFYSLP